jgi:DNA-binding winged helix-turn-helix (wHTH) protein/tetratricopeptide (TPR) repeat protein
LLIRFGEFEIDDEEAVLRRDGAPVAIQPKAFDVLLYLVRARGRLVHKGELLDRLWPDAVVGDHSVVRAISGARSALGDAGGPYRFIHSFARRGYRFVADVEDGTLPPAPAAQLVRDAPLHGEGRGREPGEVFVGREALLASLRGELARAFTGSLRVLLLEGEAGIGKTRTAVELERIARSLGAGVYSGWCQENEPSGPFQPWLRMLGALARSDGWAAIERARSAATRDVRALLQGTATALAQEAGLAPGEARLRLFHAVASVLGAAAAQAPLLLVVDDLHAADSSSLRLLEFLARELGDARLALLVTLRSEEVSLRHPVVATLGELTRRSRSARFELGGLAREDVGRCVEAWTGRAPEPELVEEVFRRSEGNPFFVRELSRWLSRGGAARAGRAGRGPDLPPSVRDVIRHRLQRRTPSCVDLLAFAAVIGRDFDLELLLRAAHADGEDALAALDEALAARIVEESVSEPGRWRFAHTLIQETLLAEKTPLWTAAAHRSVAAALAELDGGGDAHLIERAHHACRGADAATADEAVACALRAAERALAMTAFEEAARLVQSAASALALSPARSPARRCDLELELGRCFALAGDVKRAEEAYDEAARIADELDDPRRKLRAVLGLLGNLPALEPPAAGRIRLLEQAIEQFGAGDPALRVTALSRLGLAYAAAGDVVRSVANAERALVEARRTDDPRAVAAALVLRTTVSLPAEAPALRLARVDEALRVLARVNAPRVELECRIQRAAALLELGQPRALREECAAYGRIAARLAHPSARWYAGVQDTLLRTLAGDLAGAERSAGEAWALGRRAGHPDAGIYYAIQLTQLRFFQGSLAEMEEPLRRALGRAPTLAGLRAALALVLVETGRSKEARRELDELARGGFAVLPQDAGRLSNLSLLSLVAVSLRSASHAAELESQLAPYADRNVCAFVVSSNGAASFFLGLLARVLGQLERALARLAEAVAQNRRMEIAPWAAMSEHALAEALIAHGGPAACERAGALAASALGAAERMGMRPLAAAARRTLRTASQAPAATA